MKALKTLEGRQSGIALLTTILLLLLMSSLLVGFMLMVTSGQRLTGMNNDYGRAFYGAEAGMEKMTADLGTLFNNTYAPSAAQLSVITSAPPNLPGIQFLNPDSTSGYMLTYPVDANGNPAATNITIKSGPYQGMIALATPYTLTVTAHTNTGAEVKLQRTSQTVGIPMFQFGVFSETDLSFFPGPDFNFGGRVHTNGNLFLAAGSTLTLADRVTAFRNVIRTNLSNGWNTSVNYTGTVNITTAPGTASVRALARTEGSLVGTLGSAANDPPWYNLSTGPYASNIRGGSTAPTNPLRLAIATLGAAQPIDLIRRPVQNEDAGNPGVLGERFYAQASLKILLSDNPQDIMQLPCIDNTAQPFHLDDIARTVATWGTADAVALGNAMVAAGTTRVPLSASAGAVPGGNYSTVNGYWQALGSASVSGYIKIEAQTAYGSPCGTWRDVTREVLSLGYAGRNTNPQTGAPALAPILLALPAPGAAAEVAPSTCADPHPNAVVRLERIRDNPSNYVNTVVGRCGMTGGVPPALPMDYWPNVFFDTREGLRRDVKPAAPFDGRVTLGGVMHYVELNVNNLARWFNGAIGTSGPLTRDSAIAPYNFVVYFSDRRSNYVAGPIAGGWPPASPIGNETGEYGFQDFVNSGNQFGCPNATVDQGEDLDALGPNPFFTYGQASPPAFFNTLLVNSNAATVADPNCAVVAPAPVWPGTFLLKSNEARQNPPAFFRRALKLTNGSLINLGACPGGVACGLTVATENPAYIQGDYNCGSAPTCTGFNNPHVATAVIADTFTFLSRNWNDVNSFLFPYQHANNQRNALTTWYRVGIVAGKGISFQQPVGYATPQDFGTDGGTHNFLRFVENWGGQTLNYRGSILSMYYNRQAIGLYKCCATVYSPPNRGYNFDVEFLQPSLLPPRTPMFRDDNTTGFSQLILPKQ